MEESLIQLTNNGILVLLELYILYEGLADVAAE